VIKLKKLNICKFIFIINLLILSIIISFNINLNNKSALIKEERNNLLTELKNTKNDENINCAYILEKLSEKPCVSVKSVENEKNHIYVNLKYYGNKEELKNFIKSVISSKYFKSIKNLSINKGKIENNSDENNNGNSNNNEEEKADIILEYSKKLN
jgi:hypothetical protein